MNCSICPLDGILSATTSPGQSEPESNDNERALYILKAPGYEPNHQIQFSDIPRTLVSGGGLTPQQKRSWYILQLPAVKAASVIDTLMYLDAFTDEKC